MGIHLLHCVHGEERMALHDVVWDVFMATTKDARFHVSWEQTHILPPLALKSLHNGLDSIEKLGIGRGYTIFREISGGVDVVDISAPSIKLWHLFNTFLVACPFVTFKCCNISSHCNVALSNSSSFKVLVLNSFNVSHSLSFKVTSAKTNYR